MEKFIEQLNHNDFLEMVRNGEKEIHHIAIPCKIRFEEEIISSLKENYKKSEQIGGILYAKPTMIENEKFFIVNKVSYIRNAIEDKPREGRDKTNAYLSDISELEEQLSNVFNDNCLPLKFQTHPEKCSNDCKIILDQYFRSDSSYRNNIESYFRVGTGKLLMPRCLIIGSDISDNIFIGVLGNFITPICFDTSKKDNKNADIHIQ